jgi:vitamin K-dependent gamma-carboxylase
MDGSLRPVAKLQRAAATLERTMLRSPDPARETLPQDVEKTDGASTPAHAPSLFGLPTSWSALFAPVDIAFLVAFRITLGLILLYHTLDYGSSGELRDFVDPQFHFKYYGWEWVSVPQGNTIYYLFAVLGFSSFFVAIGFCYRASAIVMFGTFLWSFLAERCLYNNHYYLTALIAFWMIFMPAARAFSIDAWLGQSFRPLREANGWQQFCEAWNLGLLRFLVGLPYVFGAVAKLNSDWLNCEPMRLGMAVKKDRVHVILGQFFEQEWMVVLFSYGGLLLDLLIVPALLYRPTRWIAFGFGVVFHILNLYLFDIGYFPYFMIPATLIFFEPSWPRNAAAGVSAVLQLACKNLPDAITAIPQQMRRWQAPLEQPVFDAAAPLGWRRRSLIVTLVMFCSFQIIWPLRHYAIGGNPSWTEEGHLFSWHMMLRNKVCLLFFLKKDPHTGETSLVNYHPSAKEVGGRPYLTDRQATKLGKDPHMLVQYAHFLAEKEKEKSGKSFEIRAISLVALNGRRPRLLINPNVDLARMEPGWKLLNMNRPANDPLILPLDEPLRIPAFRLEPKYWLDPSLDAEIRVMDDKTLELLPVEFRAWILTQAKSSTR